ncbi:AAA family ATPase [Zooshikella ganghwensis]|uniref:TOMM system kinase/cyclase fusion protein n=1 Tax=Zooshikella ganghwensis TaxID=202772 RepID=A0A4P9VRX6_9GAMM|nr:AAA family ATPase [Zooshikella ganghwensis]RDH44922.1 TOMM system kinase/cyclase fusion protein [Zooshikella ganghwensis]
MVFLECLTGQPAVSGSNLASIFHKQLSPSNIPLPSAVAGHPIATFLRRVLNKKVSERANKAEDLYQELNKINLATLVGDITDKIVPSSQVILAQPTEIYNTVNHTIDNTIVAKSQLFYTALTEVKQLTVLCITLTIKSVIESTLDAEILDTLHRDQKAQCVDIAIRFGAYHVGTLGDTLLFYFGYPKVSDNDCRLCARTALEISSNLSKSNALLKKSQGVEILPAMGMHTGAVTIYADTTPEGETPNIAMALSRMALPMQIICSESSKNQLERYIEFEKITAKLPVHHQRARTLFSLKGERAVEAFGFLRANHANQSFIARRDELEKLIALLPSESLIPTTALPELKIAHIYGEAGIGKSRLTFELRRKSKNCNHFITQCLPEHKHNALYPVFNLLKYQYSLSRLTPEEAVSHFRTEINKFSQLDEKQSIPIICSWLGLPLPSGIEQIIATPETQKHILFDTLKFLISRRESFSSKQCNLFVFEDIHWADPTTLEFIAFWLLNSHESRASSVFISTSREPLPEDLSEIGFMVIELSKLDYKNTAEFIISRFDHQQVSAQVLDVVATRTDGIPLFIEEMVNMLKQKNLIHHLNGVIDFSGPDKINQVPSSLRESLQQKLDSLVYAKETAQLAATIGREFDYKLLVLASIRSEEQIQTDLNELVEAGMIYLQRKIGDDSYIFKHALVRDAAYESIPAEKIKEFHKYVADTLVSYFDSFIKNNPSIVADHYYKANDFIHGSLYGIKDVSNLSLRSLEQEAEKRSDQINSRIDLIKNSTLSDKSVKLELQLQLNSAVLPVSTKIQGWGSDKIKQLAEHNIKLVKSIKSYGVSKISQQNLDQFKYKAEWTLLIYHHYQGNRKKARKLGETLLSQVKEKRNRIQELIVRTTLGQAYFFDGDFDLAKETLAWVIDNYDHEKDINLNIEYGFDPYHFSIGNLMAIAALTGHISRAVELRDNCLEHAVRTNNISTITTGYTWGTIYYFIMYDRDGMEKWCKDAIKKHGDRFQHNWILEYFYMNYDWTQNKFERAAKTVRDRIDSGQIGILHWYDPLLARTYINHKMYNEAVDILENSLMRSKKSGDVCILSIIYRYLAIAYYYQAGYLSEKCEDCFQQAISEAKQRNSVWQELLAIYDFIKYSGSKHHDNELDLRLSEIICSIRESNGDSLVDDGLNYVKELWFKLK